MKEFQLSCKENSLQLCVCPHLSCGWCEFTTLAEWHVIKCLLSSGGFLDAVLWSDNTVAVFHSDCVIKLFKTRGPCDWKLNAELGLLGYFGAMSPQFNISPLGIGTERSGFETVLTTNTRLRWPECRERNVSASSLPATSLLNPQIIKTISWLSKWTTEHVLLGWLWHSNWWGHPSASWPKK